MKDKNVIYPKVIEVEHGVKIICNKETLLQIKNNPTVTNKYKLNIKRLNVYKYSVYFQDKSRCQEVIIDGKKYCKYY